MLSNQDYIKEFRSLQNSTVSATVKLIETIKPSQNEQEIADRYNEILNDYGFQDYWYPTLVYIGDMTGKPITRRVHLPSKDIFLHDNELIFLDCTPMKKTIWTNWCCTFVLGNDSFYESIVCDVRTFVDKLSEYALNEAHIIGDIYRFGLDLLSRNNMEILDPNKDFGHSIFQIPEGQTVEKTPPEDRIFINENHANKPLTGILSIEPQLGRISPNDGKMYGAKLQNILYFE